MSLKWLKSVIDKKSLTKVIEINFFKLLQLSVFFIKRIDFSRFNDIFAIKWLLLIISKHGFIENIGYSGA